MFLAIKREGFQKINLQSKIILLQCRGLGDAVISTAVVNSIGHCFPGTKIDILGSTQAKAIFQGNPYVGRYYEAQFPIAAGLKFSIYDAQRLLCVLRNIRLEHYGLCVNLVGDFRENVIGWLTGSPVHLAPIWKWDHPFRQLIRVGLLQLPNAPLAIGSTTYSIYDAFREVTNALGCNVHVGPKIFVDANILVEAAREQAGAVIGIHPFARQECKLWEGEKWKQLIVCLLAEGHRVKVFGAPTDQDTANEWFGSLLTNGGISCIFGELSSFFAKLATVDILIGLDSFSIHAAHALNVPSIVLNGSNDFRVWASPTTSVVLANHGCPYCPCFNRPKCLRLKTIFECMRSIQVETVLNRAGEILKARGCV